MTRKYDPDDTEMVAERQQAQDLRKAQNEADWNWMLTAPQGRRIIGDILASAGLFRLSYTPNDALATAFAEGKRALALETVYAAVIQTSYGAVINDLMIEALTPNGDRARRTTGR